MVRNLWAKIRVPAGNIEFFEFHIRVGIGAHSATFFRIYYYLNVKDNFFVSLLNEIDVDEMFIIFSWLKLEAPAPALIGCNSAGPHILYCLHRFFVGWLDFGLFEYNIVKTHDERKSSQLNIMDTSEILKNISVQNCNRWEGSYFQTIPSRDSRRFRPDEEENLQKSE